MMSRKAYPTDPTDVEWKQIQPLIPPGKADQAGRVRIVEVLWQKWTLLIG